MKRLFRWFWLLNKRLYKKPAFVIILCIIPLCILAFSIAARGDSGFLHIGIAQTDPTDEASSNVIDKLLSEKSMIRYTVFDTPENATEAVINGKTDAAWILPDGLENKMNDFADSFSNDKFVTVIERETNILLRLSHEKLSGALFEYTAKAYYLLYAREKLEELDFLSDEELLDYYNNVAISDNLFIYENPELSGNSTDGSDYLTSPIRGLLGVIGVLCGMAAAMFALSDEKAGTFSHVPEGLRIYVSFACILIAVLNVTVVMALSLFISGLYAGILRELVCIVLYALTCSAFCLLLKQIFKSIRAYSAVIPLGIILMIAICPVFFDFRSLYIFQHLLPPTYFVNAAYDVKYLLYMPLFSVACLALSIGVDLFTNRRKR